MIQYCIDSILCSGLLFLLYKVLLENEKMHLFKRFYLLFSIVLSLVAPLITLTFSSSFIVDEHPLIPEQAVSSVLVQQTSPSEANSNLLSAVVFVIYIVVCSITLLRFARKLLYFFKMSKNGLVVFSNGARIVLIEQNIHPHSFLNSIFLNAAAYKNKEIKNEIISHEVAHVKQYHSVDILFAQLIQCIYWFNPFFIFYTKAIQLNHEFLADEAVIKSSKDAVSYQYLLINTASPKSTFSLASQFNYSIIKKRLVMISKSSSPQKLFIKQMVAIFLFAAAGFLFVSKEIVAQTTTPQTQRKEVPSTKEGASPELMNEYEAIVARHKNIAQGNSEISEGEKNRLLEIYQRMTKEQQAQQVVVFWHKPPVKKKNPPTQAQIKEWVDAQKYFVRINGYKIKNSQLNNHRASDFDYVEIYKPNKGSTDYGKYDAQISLMTKEAYAKYTAFWEKEPLYWLAIRAKHDQPGQNKK